LETPQPIKRLPRLACLGHRAGRGICPMRKGTQTLSDRERPRHYGAKRNLQCGRENTAPGVRPWRCRLRSVPTRRLATPQVNGPGRKAGEPGRDHNLRHLKSPPQPVVAFRAAGVPISSSWLDWEGNTAGAEPSSDALSRWRPACSCRRREKYSHLLLQGSRDDNQRTRLRTLGSSNALSRALLSMS
jgi:hypothetical protein